MPAPAPSPAAPVPALPRLTFVTGTDAAAVARWIGEALAAAAAGEHCAVLACPEIASALACGAHAAVDGGVSVLQLPCLCCPTLADLARQVRDCARERGAEHLLVALPVLAAAGLVAEFDAHERSPREFVLCVDARWAAVQRADQLSYFQFSLLSAADRVVETTRRRPVLLCA